MKGLSYAYAYDANLRLTGRMVDGATETFSCDAINRETGDTNPLGAFTTSYLGETNQPTEQDIAGVPYRVRYDYESNTNDRRLKDIYNETVIHHMSRPVADFAYTTSPENLILSRTENTGSTASQRHRGWNIGHHYGWSHSHHWGVWAWLMGGEPGKDDDPHGSSETNPGQGSGHSNQGHHNGHGPSSGQPGPPNPGQPGQGDDDHNAVGRHHRRQRDTDGDDHGGQGTTATVATNYTYDNDLRLTGASGGLTESYLYDPADNLSSITESGTTTAISVTGTNEILAAGSSNYVYDADGNVLDDGTHTYTWDAANRLISITDKATGHVSTFTYDGWSHRVTDTETDSGGTPVTTQYLWCGNRLCEKRDASGNALARYYPQGELQGTQAYFYAQDQVGSVVALVDSSGNIAGQVSYDSYGHVISSSGTLPDFRYAQLYAHDASGLDLATYRAYDSGVGRWLTRDPIGLAGGLNLFAYVSNNPADWLDPNGEGKKEGLIGCALIAALHFGQGCIPDNHHEQSDTGEKIEQPAPVKDKQGSASGGKGEGPNGKKVPELDPNNKDYCPKDPYSSNPRLKRVPSDPMSDLTNELQNIIDEAAKYGDE